MSYYRDLRMIGVLRLCGCGFLALQLRRRIRRKQEAGSNPPSSTFQSKGFDSGALLPSTIVLLYKVLKSV